MYCIMGRSPGVPRREMRRLLPIALAAALSASAVLHADDLVLSRFSDYLESLRQQTGVPGLAATIIAIDDVQWRRVYGLADVDRNIPIRTDTPFALDGLTPVLSASLVLPCVDQGTLSLTDRFEGATLAELLSHSTAGPNGSVFAYRTERLHPVAKAIAECSQTSFDDAMGMLLVRLAMIDSAPGLDTLTIDWPPPTRARYTSALERLARPYISDGRGRPALSSYHARALTPASGVIASLDDLVQFDLALKRGVLLPNPDMLSAAWTPPLDANGQRLPHGLGWFVQTYNGERIVWQFGVSDNVSSSLLITVPGRGLTFILLANSQGLTRPFPLAAGDVTVSPFARLFLSTFVR